MAIEIKVTAETATEAKLQVLDLANIMGGSVAVTPEAPAEEKPKRGSKKEQQLAQQAEPTTQPEPEKQQEAQPEPEQDDAPEEQSTKPKISDEELRAAANEKLGAGKRAEVKALVAEYGASAVTGVEQKDRAAFLAKLKAL